METETTPKPETFDVPVDHLPALDAKLEKFARKAEKLGMTPITYEIVTEKTVRLLTEDGWPTGRVRRIAVIKLLGAAPVVAGYKFVARTEHTNAGNIMAKAPGCEDLYVPAEIRDGGAYCDHCKTVRNRIDTFILQTPEGSLMRVGRNCLADFIRSEDAAVAIALWAIIADIRRPVSDEDESYSRRVSDLSLSYFVAAAFRAVEKNGWTSRKESREGEKAATADDALFASSHPPMDPKLLVIWKEAQPVDANFETAKAAIEWARALTGSSDYEHNLKVVCSLDYVTVRNAGLAASVIVGYKRHIEQELEKTRTPKNPSEFFGTVSKRYVRKLTVRKTMDFPGDFGLTVLYVFEDEIGNQFKWFSSGGTSAPVEPIRELEAGDTFVFSFTVKSHGDYKGEKVTTIQRASAAETVEAHKIKWLHATTGEVFGTKKALLAAG